MMLVYQGTDLPVKVGDTVELRQGEEVEVVSFREPHKPSSSGKISVKSKADLFSREYYVGVIGAHWIERQDQIGWN